MNRDDKTAVIERLRAVLDGVPAVVVADFKGLTVEQAGQIRSAARNAGVAFEVVKNTLIIKATEGTSKAGMSDLFRGNTAIAYHPEDPAAAARVATEFVKTNDKLRIKGAWLDGRVLDASGVEALSKLPGKDELRGQMLSVFLGVPTKFVRTLIAAPQTFAMLLRARAQQLGEG